MTVLIAPKRKIVPTTEEDLLALIAKLAKEMKRAAKNMEFERAAELRDEIKESNKILLTRGAEHRHHTSYFVVNNPLTHKILVHILPL